MKRYLLLTYFLFLGLFLSAQIGGTKVYEFLNLPQSARVTALGGYLFSVADEDVNLAYSNPAALNPMMSGNISFSHNFQLADLNNGHVAYAKYVKKHTEHALKTNMSRALKIDMSHALEIEHSLGKTYGGGNRGNRENIWGGK